MPRPNDRIGPYQLIRKLGEGGFGEVWLAQDFSGSTPREVAVKMPLDTEIDLDALLQEATLWARATGHANVLEFLAARVFDGQVVLVSEYAPDGSLKDWLNLYGRRAPSVEAAVKMTRGILAGLEHLHGRNIIHRDVKPDNVLLLGATPRLADFGISRVLKSTSKSAVTAGTPPYMAPEAFNRKRNQQTDLWSVGVMLYQMLSGWLPFDGNDMAELYGAILNEEPEPLPAAVPEWLRQTAAKALIKDPERRYQTAAEMSAALTPPPPRVEEKPAPLPLRTPTVDQRPPKREPTVIKPQPPKREPTVAKPAVDQPLKKSSKTNPIVLAGLLLLGVAGLVAGATSYFRQQSQARDAQQQAQIRLQLENQNQKEGQIGRLREKIAEIGRKLEAADNSSLKKKRTAWSESLNRLSRRLDEISTLSSDRLQEINQACNEISKELKKIEEEINSLQGLLPSQPTNREPVKI